MNNWDVECRVYMVVHRPSSTSLCILGGDVGTGWNWRNLSELRAKTERQVHSIIHSKLDLGLNFVALAEETDSDGNPDHAELLLWRAEQTVIEVKQLLPVLTEDQYQSIGPQLNKLQEALDRLGRRFATATMS
jgi:hypothetical protein